MPASLALFTFTIHFTSLMSLLSLQSAMRLMLQSSPTGSHLHGEGMEIISAFMLWLLIRGVIRLQSLLTRAAGYWQQRSAWMVRLRSRSVMSRTRTSTAELYYLCHMRSCAAAALGKQGSSSSTSTALQTSGANFICSLLQSAGRHCFFTIFISVDWLLQSVTPWLRYYAKIVLKLMLIFFAMLREMLTWCTPLELAACLHLASAGIDAMSVRSAQEMAVIALALAVIGGTHRTV